MVPILGSVISAVGCSIRIFRPDVAIIAAGWILPGEALRMVRPVEAVVLVFSAVSCFFFWYWFFVELLRPSGGCLVWLEACLRNSVNLTIG